MCEEESDDHEAVAKLLQINDSIHRTIERYDLIRKGDFQAASNIPVGTLGTSGAGVSRGANNELSLIDFGGPEETAANDGTAPSATNGAANQSSGNHLEDDLLGLSLGGDTYGQGGALSLGTSNGTNIHCSRMEDAPRLTEITVPTQSSHKPSLSNSQITDMFGLQSQPAQPPPQFASMQNSLISLPLSSPSPINRQPPPQQPAISNARNDPFASLSSLTPRTGSPMPAAAPRTSTPQQNRLSQTIAAPPVRASMDDDEWTFASALPETSREITVTKGVMTIQWSVTRTAPSTVQIRSRVSSNVSEPITELTFQVAVTKVRQSTLR